MLKDFITDAIGRFEDLQFSRETRRALLLVGALILGSGVLLFFISHGTSSAATPPIASSGVLIPSPAAPVFIIVDVAGKVKRPGVYSLPQGSRAIDAIKAAGNKLPGVDTSDINLAHRLVDGEQIVIGAPKFVTSSNKGKSSIPKRSGPISINNGTQAELESLPGIGPVMASRIIAYRKLHGAFPTIDELKNVSGMRKTTFAEISLLVRL